MVEEKKFQNFKNTIKLVEETGAGELMLIQSIEMVLGMDMIFRR